MSKNCYFILSFVEKCLNLALFYGIIRHILEKRGSKAYRTLNSGGKGMRMVVNFNDSTQMLAVNYSSIQGNNMPRCHSHSHYELYYITEGERYLLVRDRFYHLVPGDIFLILPGVEHRTLDVNEDTYTRFTASISPSILPANVEKKLSRGLHIVRPDAELRTKIDSEAAALLRAIKSDEQGIEALSATVKMVQLLLGAEDDGEQMAVANPTLDRMAGMLSYIEQHYTEDISIAVLSERFFISEFYLCRLFKEYTGKTIFAYIIELRIKHAQRMLRLTNTPIKKIAQASGYGSLSAFGKAFHATTGVSPREYRKGNGALLPDDQAI